MLSVKTFEEFLNMIEYYQAGLSNLETTLNVMFDDNFLTNSIDNLITALANSFFTDEELDDDNTLETASIVTDIIYHYCFTSDFGLRSEKLKKLYIEDEGLETEEVFDACTPSELYNLINRYIHPVRKCKTYTLRC